MSKKKEIMIYTEDEICQMYRDAKKKKEQIKYLAEMNITSPDKIVAILQSHGYETPGYEKIEKPKPRTKSERDKIAAIEFEEKQRDLEHKKPKTGIDPVLLTHYHPPDAVWVLVERRIEELNELTERCQKIIADCTEEFGKLYEFKVAYGKAGEIISQEA